MTTKNDSTENVFYELDAWVFDQETAGVSLTEIIDILQEYTEILIDLEDDRRTILRRSITIAMSVLS